MPVCIQEDNLSLFTDVMYSEFSQFIDWDRPNSIHNVTACFMFSEKLDSVFGIELLKSRPLG